MEENWKQAESNFYKLGNVKHKIKPQPLSSDEIENLKGKFLSSSHQFQNAKKIRNCFVNGFYVESRGKEKKSDNSLIMVQENLFGKIIKILIIKNEVYFVLHVEYKIFHKEPFSQYYILKALPKELFYIRNAKKFQHKVIFSENEHYFVIPPNNIECD